MRPIKVKVTESEVEAFAKMDGKQIPPLPAALRAAEAIRIQLCRYDDETKEQDLECFGSIITRETKLNEVVECLENMLAMAEDFQDPRIVKANAVLSSLIK